MSSTKLALILFEYESSSSDEEEVLKLAQPNKIPDIFWDDDSDDPEDTINIINPIINGVQRINRVTILNYIENTVHLYSDCNFVTHFRLRRKITYELIARFEVSAYFIQLNNSFGRKPITAEKHILTFLWYVGHQSCYRDIADRFGITLSSLFAIISRVSNFLLSIGSEIIKFPTIEAKNVTETHFRENKKFPGVIGAVDGTHIQINRPRHDRDSYYTRKKNFAIHMQGLVNHKKKFLDVCIGYPASVHDARVFKSSDIFHALPTLCPGNLHILGDSAYPLMKELIVPYRDNGHLTRKQKYFNYKLSSCRIAIEHAFGELKQRFRRLYFCELRSIERIVLIIYACCILHNLADEEDLTFLEPPIVEDIIDDPGNDPLIELEIVTNNAALRSHRDDLCDLVWQMK